MGTRVDATVVGSGPNGLAAAITIARAGKSVLVLEANDTIGGAAASAELIEPGAIHDLGSAVHPLAMASPFFADIAADLQRHGLRWATPEASAAHPLDDGRAAIAWNDLDATANGLGVDGPSYRRFYQHWVENFNDLVDIAMNPPTTQFPRRPLFAARFGAFAALPATTLAKRLWQTPEAQALFAGHVGHSILPLTSAFTSAVGILFGAMVHGVGWGFPEGGAQQLTNSMVSYLEELGGEVKTAHRVESLADIPQSSATVFSLTPRQIDAIATDHFDGKFRKQLQQWKYGSAAWKVDYVLDEPIPWTNTDVAQAGTVHVGGTIEEINRAETDVANGRLSDTPFVLLAQPTNFDQTRAPAGRHIAWVYCHVPNGCTIDQTPAIESQIERFAPGFRDTVRAKFVSSPATLESQNANLFGGDIAGGSSAGSQLLFRPRKHPRPHDTPDPSLFLGSASTTPGAGVHGMSGHRAALRALQTALR